MYDRRTRYSRIVLEKVKAEFGDNVFDMSVKSPVIEQPTYEMEEFSTYSPQSNYSEMVETIATKSTDSFLYDEDE